VWTRDPLMKLKLKQVIREGRFDDEIKGKKRKVVK
jgi:hypothetical protein